MMNARTSTSNRATTHGRETRVCQRQHGLVLHRPIVMAAHEEVQYAFDMSTAQALTLAAELPRQSSYLTPPARWRVG